ncbi:MAG: threonine/serine exporter family protein [Clostridia bacterium]|nr:threonine/serine exporter family protein [Clostridia bacterium]
MTDFNTAIVQIITGCMGSFGFSILYNIRGRKLVLAGLGGAFSWTLCILLQFVFPSEALRYFFSAAFVAVYAEILARKLKTPTTTFLVPAIIPHVPGRSLYYTMKYALNEEWNMFFSQAFATVQLALALAMGIIAVSSLVKVIFSIMWSIRNSKKAKQ